jgi:hypothetical protein
VMLGKGWWYWWNEWNVRSRTDFSIGPAPLQRGQMGLERQA